MKHIDLNLSHDQIEAMSKYELKKLIKLKIRSTTKEELERVKQGHSKVQNIIHTDMKFP